MELCVVIDTVDCVESQCADIDTVDCVMQSQPIICM